MLGQSKMCSYVFDDYWEDIGTVKAFFDSNIRLTDPVPPFNFFDEDARLYSCTLPPCIEDQLMCYQPRYSPTAVL